MTDLVDDTERTVSPPAHAEGYRGVVRRHVLRDRLYQRSGLHVPAEHRAAVDQGLPGQVRRLDHRLTPNQVTAVSAMCSAAAIALMAVVAPAPLVGVAITALLLLGYALDSADGQLARLRGMSSTSGEWLDHMVDCAKISSMHLAVLVGLYRFGYVNSGLCLLVPLGFCVVATVLFFGMTLKDQLRRVRAATLGVPGTAPRDASRLQSLALIPTDYGIVCAAFSLWGWRSGFLVAYAALFAAHAAFLALACVKWFRDMRALDVARS